MEVDILGFDDVAVAVGCFFVAPRELSLWLLEKGATTQLEHVLADFFLSMARKQAQFAIF